MVQDRPAVMKRMELAIHLHTRPWQLLAPFLLCVLHLTMRLKLSWLLRSRSPRCRCQHIKQVWMQVASSRLCISLERLQSLQIMVALPTCQSRKRLCIFPCLGINSATAVAWCKHGVCVQNVRFCACHAVSNMRAMACLHTMLLLLKDMKLQRQAVLLCMHAEGIVMYAFLQV